MKIPPKPPTTGLSYNENQRPPIKCEVISGFYDDQSAGPLRGERLPRKELGQRRRNFLRGSTFSFFKCIYWRKTQMCQEGNKSIYSTDPFDQSLNIHFNSPTPLVPTFIFAAGRCPERKLQQLLHEVELFFLAHSRETIKAFIKTSLYGFSPSTIPWTSLYLLPKC